MGKHSKLGISSFIIAIVFLIYHVVLAYFDIIQTFNDTQIIPGYLYVLGSLFSMIMQPFGAGLGLAAILEKDTKKGVGIWGLTINGLFSILTVLSVIPKIYG
ncbi:hypothetical protein [Vallitalea okinawensis]|uniref:hypothetical protein n=1 Tax=Vallitalea okinawensis TaxID=2078660 RepID=UPI000CFA9352|nr:hypothetical protein [Vallitalea okinawensis]